MISEWYLGVFLASISAFLGNFSVTLQKMDHTKHREPEAGGRSRRSSSAIHNDIPPGSPGAGASMALAARHTMPVDASSAVTTHNAAQRYPPYYKRWRWQMGLCGIFFASLLDFVALGFAPQSLIAPLGSLNLVSNTLLAAWLLGERISARDKLCTLGILVGSAISVAFAPHRNVRYPLPVLFQLFFRWPFLIYVAAVIAYVIVMQRRVRVLDRARWRAIRRARSRLRRQCRRHNPHDRAAWYGAMALSDVSTKEGEGDYGARQRREHRFLFPSLAGLCGAQSILLAKCAIELLFHFIRGTNVFLHAPTYVIVGALCCSIMLQVQFLNDGLRLFDASYVVPVFTAFWVSFSVLSGMAFYREYTVASTESLVVFALGLLFSLASVAALSQNHKIQSPTELAALEEQKEALEEANVGETTLLLP